MPDDVKLLPCPFCGTTEQLVNTPCGSMTVDMPSQPYRVVCTHLDCENVSGPAGPVGYGKNASADAWNRRALPSLPSDIDGLVEELERGLEGTSDGPWHTHRRSYDIVVRNADHYLLRTEQWGRLEPADAAQMKANAEHVARCSPANIRKLIAALRARQAPEGVVEAVAKAIFDTWAKFKGVDGTWEEALQGHFEGSDTYPAAHEIVELARLEARAALSAMPSGAGWQPIDTAPKDGKTILAAHKHAIFTVYWEAEGDTDTDEPGWCDGDMNRYEELTTYNPTHWMPLPAPPAGQPS